MLRDNTIRNHIISDLLPVLYRKEEYRVIEEFDICLGETRADIAVVNGSLIGYEIKSDLDDLSRLVKQIPLYEKIFDRVEIFVGSTHATNASHTIPKWCGITEVFKTKTRIRSRVIRKSKVNPRVDVLSLIQVLWKTEIIQYLERYSLSPNLNKLPRHELWQQVVQEGSTKKIKKHVNQCLKLRTNWK